MKIAKSPVQSTVYGMLIILFVLLLSSCGNKSELSNNIPKNASVVLAFDVKSMGLKSVDFKEMLSFDKIKKALGSIGEEKDTTKVSINDSGVDFLTKSYLFVSSQGATPYGGVIAALSDAKKFEDFIKKSDSEIVVTEEGKVKLANFAENKGMVAWTDTKVVVLFGTETAKETALSIINLKKEESLASVNDSFKESMKADADISAWMSFEDLMKMVPQYNSTMQTANLKETFMTGTCNFEDGEIVVEGKYTMNPEMAAKFNFYKASISNDVISVMPGKSLIGMFGFALDMEKIYTYLENEKLLDAYAPTVTQMTGLTVKELLTMFSGDFAMTVNGVEMKPVQKIDYTTGEMRTSNEPTPDYTAVMGLADKDKATKMLDQFVTAGFITKPGAYYTFQNKVFVILKGSALFVTGTESTRQAILDGKTDKLNSEVISLLSSNASSMYVNLLNVPSAAYSEGIETRVKDSELEEIEFTGTTVSGTESKGKMIFKFKNKKENSLVTLSRVSKKFGDLMKQARPPVMEEIPTDTVAAPY